MNYLENDDAEAFAEALKENDTLTTANVWGKNKYLHIVSVYHNGTLLNCSIVHLKITESIRATLKSLKIF